MTQVYPPQAVIQIVPGYRLHYEETEKAYVLLYPEGMVTLDLCATEILCRCDGTRTVEEIICDLKTRYPYLELETTIVDFIGKAESKGWIRIV